MRLSAALIGLVLMALAVSSADTPATTNPPITLSKSCPPGFELVNEQRCELRSLYQFYDSNQGRGVGGTQTGLPPYRDGFSPQQIDLGRYLFFDPILSSDQSLACASCHQPQKAFSDGLALSSGVGGRLGKRSTPSLWNMAFLPYYFWDARAKTLEEQAAGPLFTDFEMANTPANLLATLRNSASYQALFKQAFPQQQEVELSSVYQALAAFQSSLISLNSRYDQYAHGNHSALTENEIAGLNVFRSFVARCAECHTPPLFTNNQIAVIGTPEPQGRPLDAGAQITLGADKLRAGFKVPSLRNVTKTAPYMHSGVFATLAEAAEFYTGGRGHAIPEGEDIHIHWHIWEPNLQKHEIGLLVDFLGALEDQSFMPAIPAANPSGLPSIFSTKSNNQMPNQTTR